MEVTICDIMYTRSKVMSVLFMSAVMVNDSISLSYDGGKEAISIDVKSSSKIDLPMDASCS